MSSESELSVSEGADSWSEFSDDSDYVSTKTSRKRKKNNEPSSSTAVIRPTKRHVKNSKSLRTIAVTIDGPPGRYKCYIAWMSCLDPSDCPFGQDCFNFIFGNSDQKYSSITQSRISRDVTSEFNKRKALLPTYSIPQRPIDLSDEEESELTDYSYDGKEEDSDSSDDDDPEDKQSDTEQEKAKKKSGNSCKEPFDFLLQYPNHEFRKGNCLTLWTTNNRKLKRTLKNFPRGAYKDISKAKGMYPQMSSEAYNIFDSLGVSLPFRKKYIIRAQKEHRLLHLPIKQSPSTSNFNVEISQEQCD